MDIRFLIQMLMVHLVVSTLYSILILSHRSSLTPANILIIFCIPVFGLLSALTAELINHFKPQKDTVDKAEFVSLSEDIYWKSIKKREEAQNIIPLEEALIINDRQTRKKLLLEMLLDDPMRNIDILLLARENNDADTAHFANTTIAKIQRDFQLQVQKLAASHESDPEDMNILNSYIEVLGQFIESRLSEAYLLKRQRILYDNLLDTKIEIKGWSREILNIKIRNCLALKDINGAVDANDILLNNFPNDEQTWINALQISVAGHDNVRLGELINEIKSRDIEWSPSGKEQIRTWIEVK